MGLFGDLGWLGRKLFAEEHSNPLKSSNWTPRPTAPIVRYVPPPTPPPVLKEPPFVPAGWKPPPRPEDPMTVARKRLEKQHHEIEHANISEEDRRNLHEEADRAFVLWCRRNINGY